MASRKHLRELFNLRHSKCRSCERSKTDLLVQGGERRRRPKVKPLFHSRPWMSQSQCHKSNNNWDRFTQEIANMAEEVEEVRARFEEVRRDPRRVREQLRLLYNESESHFEEMDSTN